MPISAGRPPGGHDGAMLEIRKGRARSARAMWAALALSGGVAAVCAAPLSAQPAEEPATACTATPGFAEALQRALPGTVGIYAVGRPGEPPGTSPGTSPGAPMSIR